MVKGSMAVSATPKFGVFFRNHLLSRWYYRSLDFSLKLTQHLKMDGWETIYFYFGNAYFQGQAVSFREGNFFHPSRQETKPSNRRFHGDSFRGAI